MVRATTFKLVAALTNAGGLGSFACDYMQPEAFYNPIQKTRLLTDKSIDIHLFIPEKHAGSTQQIKRTQTTLQTLCLTFTKDFSSTNALFTPDLDAQLQVILEEKFRY